MSEFMSELRYSSTEGLFVSCQIALCEDETCGPKITTGSNDEKNNQEKLIRQESNPVTTNKVSI